MMTFSRALPMFAAVLTLVYTVLLLMSKVEKAEGEIGKGSRIYALASVLTSVLAIVGVSLTLLTEFRDAIPYYILLAVITTLIIATGLNTNSPSLRKMLLFSTIMWHMTMVSGQYPPIGISVWEKETR